MIGLGWAPPDTRWLGGLVLLLGLLAVAAPHAGSAAIANRRLGTGTQPGRGFGWLRLHERIGSASPLLLLGVFALALAAGWADAVRGWLGDAWIADDLVTLAPPVLATVAMDLGSWPLVRRFREATLLRRADAGRPIHPVPGRWAYAWGRLRGGPGLIGVPLLLILGWTQALDLASASATLGPWLPAPGGGWGTTLSAAGSLGVIALSPPLLVRALPTVPLPPGPLRDDLLGLLASERVATRGLRLWRTGGAVANAALVGVLPRLRYLLLSDRLLDELPREELRAVLLHETGHARHRHLPWLGAAALAPGVLALLALDAADARGWLPGTAIPVAATAAAAAGWLVWFGWFSRRVEGQADAHAAEAGSDASTRFTPLGVEAVSSALARVGRLAGSPASRRSYRHGSIASRRAALARLLDEPNQEPAAGRALRRGKLALAAMLAGAVALAWWG